ncbi:MAG: hypothetical protein PHF84_11520 [bacterium]|nr:hypothetical protein [bacterium]
MKTRSLFFCFMFFLSFLAAGKAEASLLWWGSLDVNSDNNVFRDYSGEKDVYYQLDFSVGNRIDELPTLIWDYELYLEKFSTYSSEDFHSHNLNLLFRSREDMALLDLNAGANFSFQFKDKTFNYTDFYLSGMYRWEWTDVTLGLKYDADLYTFPDYPQLSSFQNAPSAFFSLDLWPGTTLDLDAVYHYILYRDRYVLDEEGYQTSDLVRTGRAFLDGSLTQVIFDVLRITAGYLYEWNDSNENFYFSGPEETNMILSGDEMIVKNYADYHASGLKCHIFWNVLEPFSVYSRFLYQEKKYSQRQPYDSAGMLMTDKKLSEKITDWTIGVEMNLTDFMNIHGEYEFYRDDSNDYFLKGSAVRYQAGVKIFF